MPDEDHRLGHRSRLRERFLKGGLNAVAEYEMLELLLFAARPRGDVKPLAKSLLQRFGSFAGVIRAEPAELRAVDGVGDAVIATLRTVSAATELLLKSDIEERPIIQSWTSLLDYCRLKLGEKRVEEFHVLFLDKRNALIADEMQTRGTIDHTAVYPREILKRALEHSASAIILVHNHPGGDPAPSKEDIEMTKAIIQAARPFNIRIHDHLIMAKNAHFSFKSHRLL